MDNWYYLSNGTVVNIWEDEGVNVNFYIVPEDKIANYDDCENDGKL